MIKNITIGIIIALIACGAGFYIGRNYDSASSTASELIDAKVAGTPVPQEGDTMLYSSSLYKFSLQYPKELGAVSDTDEGGDAHTIVFETPQRDKGFQIYVQPYAQTEISREKFLADSPSGVMKDSKQVVIGGQQATMFFGYADGIGETREVWFIHNGFLYEIVTYKALDSWLAQILSTWRFTQT